MRRFITVLSFVLFTSLCLSAIHSPSVFAVHSDCYFGSGDCSINGNGDYGTNDLFTGRSGPDRDVLGGINSKTEFINFITGRFSDGGHNKTGAQFIIKNMLSDVSGRPDSSDVARWKVLMKQDDVKFSISDHKVTVDQTSWYVPSKNDVIHDTPYDGGGRPRYVIYIKQDGKIVAEVEISCGNLTAKHAKLTGGWEIKPTTKVSPTQVKPTQVINWTHKAANSGGKTDEDVNWEVRQFIKASAGAPNQTGSVVSGGSGTITKGKAADYVFSKSTSYTAKDSDINKYVCQYIRVKPFKSGSDGDKWKASDPKCAKVTKTPTGPSTCDPIKIVVTPDKYTWDGKVVPVTVQSYFGSSYYHSIGTAYAKTTYDITYPHTTGETYNIHLKTQAYYDYRTWIVTYDSDGNVNGGYWLYHTAPATDTISQTVGPCFDYNVHPEVNTDTDAVEIGGDIGVTSTLSNTELSGTVEGNGTPPSKTDGSVDWRLTVLTYEPGSGIDSKSGPVASGDDVCDHFTSSGRLGCDTLEEWTNSLKANESVSHATTYPVPDDVKAGSRVCFAVSAEKPTQNDDPAWRHSNLQCVRVGKRPKMQIHGSDLRTRGNTVTSVSTIGGQTYGSWVEYGAMSIGTDNALGSGAGLMGGSGSDLSGRSDWSKLTFANDGSYGSYGSLPPVATVEATMKARGLCTENVGSMTIPAMSIDTKESHVICVSGTVTISGDIQQSDSSISKLEDIPQVMILAQNINIKAGVGQVDAWLVATGTVNTCSDQPGTTVTSCDGQLVINGPVMAGSLNLKRTYGAEGSDKDAPAEIINLRPDAYLWMYGGMGKLGSNIAVETTQITEVPPRF